jgi:hypothetical protein
MTTVDQNPEHEFRIADCPVCDFSSQVDITPDYRRYRSGLHSLPPASRSDIMREGELDAFKALYNANKGAIS